MSTALRKSLGLVIVMFAIAWGADGFRRDGTAYTESVLTALPMVFVGGLLLFWERE